MTELLQRGVLTDCALTESGTPAMTVELGAGLVVYDNDILTVAADTLTITAADADLDRYDFVGVDYAGTVTVVDGTPGVVGVDTDVTDAYVGLWIVKVAAAVTEIVTADLTDVRVFVTLASHTQTFTANGDWYPLLPNAAMARVILVGGGGGGGGGNSSAGVARSGGSGGGGGSGVEKLFRVADLTVPVSVVIGQGGSGGASDADGMLGGVSLFGTGTGYLVALGGGMGAAGGTSDISGGSGAGTGTNGAAGSASETVGGKPNPATTACEGSGGAGGGSPVGGHGFAAEYGGGGGAGASIGGVEPDGNGWFGGCSLHGGGGGGGGGGSSAADNDHRGGDGGQAGYYGSVGYGGGGAYGDVNVVIDGAIGTSLDGISGDGGGGGGSDGNGTGGDGGPGASYGGGGGGGGAGTTGQGGSGGDGADGVCIVIVW